MDNQLWLNFVPWFLDFVGTFRANGELDPRYLLKLKHSFRVVDCIGDVTQGWNREHVEIAKITALLHDVGRFPQYQKYKTFHDQESEDHAELSCQILEESGVLKRLSTEGKQILDAVRVHNKLWVTSTDPLTLALRDADKLDILYVCLRAHPNEVGEGLNPSGQISQEVSSSFLYEGLVSYEDVRSRADLYVMLLSWVFGFNSRISLRLATERGFIRELIEGLKTLDPKSRDLFPKVISFTRSRIGLESPLNDLVI